MMDKTQALIIRACKSHNPERRLKRIYESVYYNDYDSRHMLAILLEIVEKYELIKIKDLVDALNPVNAWKYGGSDTLNYTENVCKVFVSAIRLTGISKLPDYPVQLPQQIEI